LINLRKLPYDFGARLFDILKLANHNIDLSIKYFWYHPNQ